MIPTDNDHSDTIPIPGGRWHAWRLIGLRGTGFAARGVLSLAAPESANAIDRLVSGSDPPSTAELAESFSAEMRQIQTSAAAIASDPRFREAIVWQNRAVLRQTLDPLVKRPVATNWKGRQRLAVVARYLQRYCTKNETIGFFGPVGWARIEDASPPVVESFGSGFVRDRLVCFERWAIDEVARSLSERFDVRPWARPRLLPYFHVAGDRLDVPGRAPVPLPREHCAVLRACDGTRSGREVAALAVQLGAPSVQTEADAFALLAQLVSFGVIAWKLEVPVSSRPELLLREEVERIDDAEIRAPALELLDSLTEAKRAVAASVGPEALDAAMSTLEQRFTSATGAGPTRFPGELWSARTLVYEDSVRDMDVRFGSLLLERIGPALSLALDGYRWFTWNVARRYAAMSIELFDELAGPKKVSELPLTELYQAFAERHLDVSRALAPGSPIEDVIVAYQRKWLDILGGDPCARILRRASADIGPRAAEAFAAPSHGWPGAYLTPNLSVCAAGAEAFERGDFTVVLGKIHPGNTLLKRVFVEHHPDPVALHRQLRKDHPETQISPLAPAGRASRTAFGPVSSAWYRLHVSPDIPSCEPDRLLRVAEMIAYKAESGIRVRTRDGQLDGDILALLATWLAEVCHFVSNVFPSFAHQPRLMIDDLVVARESWFLAAADLVFMKQKSMLETFLEARRWARELGFPRHVFAKVDSEPKPIFVDFESPVYVDILARLIRQALEKNADARVSVVEMHPSLDELWLRDSAGRYYTSELLLVAVEPAD